MCIRDSDRTVDCHGHPHSMRIKAPVSTVKDESTAQSQATVRMKVSVLFSPLYPVRIAGSCLTPTQCPSALAASTSPVARRQPQASSCLHLGWRRRTAASVQMANTAGAAGRSRGLSRQSSRSHRTACTHTRDGESRGHAPLPAEPRITATTAKNHHTRNT